MFGRPAIFLEALTSDYVARGCFFSSEKLPAIFLEAAGSVVGVGVGCRLTTLLEPLLPLSFARSHDGSGSCVESPDSKGTQKSKMKEQHEPDFGHEPMIAQPLDQLWAVTCKQYPKTTELVFE